MRIIYTEEDLKLLPEIIKVAKTPDLTFSYTNGEQKTDVTIEIVEMKVTDFLAAARKLEELYWKEVKRKEKEKAIRAINNKVINQIKRMS